MDFSLLHFKQFLQKKSVISYLQTCNILIFSCSFTRQQIRVRLVSLAHQSHMACLHVRPGYCYARQKFGLSISAGSFIVLISQSHTVGSRKNEPVGHSRNVLDAISFYSLLSLIPSLAQLLFSVKPIFVSHAGCVMFG